MEVVQLTRKFSYNSISLGDPNPALTPEAVKEVYAQQYPELTNSVVEGPVTKDGVATYKFTRAVGSKGAKLPARQLIDAYINGEPGKKQQPFAQMQDLPETDQRAQAKIGEVALSRRAGQPLPIPATAFGLWG